MAKGQHGNREAKKPKQIKPLVPRPASLFTSQIKAAIASPRGKK